MKLKRRKKKNIVITILLIIIMTLGILNYIGGKITPRVVEIVKSNINKSIYNYIFYVFSEDVLVNEDLLNVVNLNMNDKKEVVSVDYNFNVAYKYLNEGLNRLYEELNTFKPNIKYYQEKDGVFFVPVGLINNNVLLENLGFKIPCKVNYINDIEINFRTRVSDYGLNNLLIELYLVVEVENELLSPRGYESFKEDYEIVVASKVIMGSVPDYYGGTIEKSSSIVSS